MRSQGQLPKFIAYVLHFIPREQNETGAQSIAHYEDKFCVQRALLTSGECYYLLPLLIATDFIVQLLTTGLLNEIETVSGSNSPFVLQVRTFLPKSVLLMFILNTTHA
jgi:hypothetical protein